MHVLSASSPLISGLGTSSDPTKIPCKNCPALGRDPYVRAIRILPTMFAATIRRLAAATKPLAASAAPKSTSPLKKVWPPDYAKLSPQAKLKFEKKYKRRVLLRSARPGWNKIIRLTQLFSVTCESALCLFALQTKPALQENRYGNVDGHRAQAQIPVGLMRTPITTKTNEAQDNLKEGFVAKYQCTRFFSHFFPHLGMLPGIYGSNNACARSYHHLRRSVYALGPPRK